MKRESERVVELTEAESVVKDWFDSLLDNGMGIEQAILEITNSVPIHGTTWDIINDQEFRGWLRS